MSERTAAFKLGIYGKAVQEIPDAELGRLLEEPYVEVLNEEELEAFRALLGRSHKLPQICVAPKVSVSPSDRVRMKTSEWVRFIFGPKKIVSERTYAVLIDWLLSKEGSSTSSEARSALCIDPKTLFYICKILSKMGIVSVRKEKYESVIELLPLVDRGNVKKDKLVSMFKSEDVVQRHELVHYANMSFLDQIRVHITDAPDGFGTKDLTEMTGIHPRHGLRLIQHVCSSDPENYCVTTETCYKSRTLRFFLKSNYERLRAKRIDQIANPAPEQDTKRRFAISDVEKEAAIKKLVEKYGSFTLDNEIFEEIHEITGWAYTFDRKTILRAAIRAGLEVHVEKEKGRNTRYRIETIDPAVDGVVEEEKQEEPREEACTSLSRKDPFVKKARATFIKRPHFQPYDNGFRRRLVDASRQIYTFLSERHGFGRPFSLTRDDILSMPVWLVYYVFKVPGYKFREKNQRYIQERIRKAAANDTISQADKTEAMQSTPSSMSNTIDNSDPKGMVMTRYSGYCAASDTKNSSTYYVDAMPLSQYLESIPQSARRILSERLKVEELEEVIEFLRGRLLIEYVDDSFEGRKIVMKEDDQGKAFEVEENEDEYVPLKVREEFVNYVLRNKREEMYVAALKFIEQHKEEGAEMLLRKIGIFDCEGEHEKKRKKKYKWMSNRNIDDDVTEFPEELEEAYIAIKRGIVTENFAKTIKNETYLQENELELILGHLVKRGVVRSFFLGGDDPRAHLTSLFIQKFPYLADYIKEETAVVDEYFGIYFAAIHRIVRALKRVDIEVIREKAQYLENFELRRFFSTYSDVFHLETSNGFTFVSLAKEKDPFDLIG